MDTFEAIEKRRSVKHFDPNFVMPEEDVEKLLSLSILSPTSFNVQNWRIVNVVDAEQREKIKAAAWGQAQITDASLCLVLCADLKFWAKEPERYWRDAPKEVGTFLVDSIKKFYSTSEDLCRDEALRSTGILGQTLMLAAKSMGYDSCPMVGFNPQLVAEIINLPDDHMISFIVVIGKAVQPARARGGQLPLSEIVIQDKF